MVHIKEYAHHQLCDFTLVCCELLMIRVEKKHYSLEIEMYVLERLNV